jgi:hypothetical protein
VVYVIQPKVFGFLAQPQLVCFAVVALLDVASVASTLHVVPLMPVQPF